MLFRWKHSLRGFMIATLLMGGLTACGPSNPGTSSLNLMIESARESEDRAKRQTIDAAAAIFLVEHGRNPESTQELVDAGYLPADAIIDRNGEVLPFTPHDIGGGTAVSKSCGSCGRGVPSSSKVGDTCPHCGVRWGYETTM
jgi:hypothetical protein